MDLQLKNKTALVTGASQGIGRAIAKGLTAEGATVCIAARRRHLLDTLAQEITAAGGATPAMVEIDIMQDGAPQRLADAARQALGHVDILINSAGGSRPAIPIDAPEEEWESVMMLNFVRVRQLTHAVLPDMIKSNWGRIINLSGKSEPDALLAATPAKAAVHGVRFCLAATFPIRPPSATPRSVSAQSGGTSVCWTARFRGRTPD